MNSAPAQGRAEFEFRYHEVIWRFRNPGNQAAFIANPASYEPQFGGYDPVAIGRGAPTPGNPSIWVIVGRKLYLFYSLESHDKFTDDAGRLLVRADARWGDVTKALAR